MPQKPIPVDTTVDPSLGYFANPTYTANAVYGALFGQEETLPSNIQSNVNVVKVVYVNVNNVVNPAGANNDVQLNVNNTITGDDQLQFNTTTKVLTSNNEILTGNLTVYGTSNLGGVTSVKISGGTHGEFLSTDGSGSLTWALPSDYQLQSDWNATTGVQKILNKPAISIVGITNNYNDLSNKPTLSLVATTGNYSDLTNKPAIPSIAGLASTTYVTNSLTWSNIAGKPSFATVATSGSYTDLINIPSFSTVATTGNYLDLSHRPDLSVYYTSSSSIPSTQITGLATVATTGNYDDLINTPPLAAVATSGDYTDLINPPAIPTDISQLTDQHNLLSSGGGGSSPTDRLVNGSKSVILGSDGKLTLPAGGDILDSTGNSVLGTIVSSEIAPLTPRDNQLWYDTTSGRLYLWFESAWVDASPGGAGGSSLPSQSGNTGLYLTTDGSTLSWGTPSGGGGGGSGSYANSNVAGYLPLYSGNLPNVDFITASGNVSATYFIGNGSQLTGLPASYANSNVAMYLPTYTGNLNANNITANNIALDDLGNVLVGNGLLIANSTVSFSGTGGGSIGLGTDVTTATIIMGGGLQTGNIILGRSITNSNTYIQNSELSAGNTKHIYIGTGGLSGSNTIINIGSTIGNGNVTFGTNTSVTIGNSLTVGGNVSGSYLIGNGSSLTSLTGANVSGQVGNATVAGTVYTNAQPNITSVGTLVSANITGNLSVGNVSLTGNVSSNLNVTGNIVGGGVRKTSSATKPSNPVVGDQWYNSSTDVLYQYVNDGVNSYWIDITGPTFINAQNTTKVSNYVDSGVFVSMDNIKAALTTSAPRGLSLAAVSTSFNATYGANYAVSGGAGGSSSNGSTNITTTPSGSVFGWNFTGAGDISTYIVNDTTNRRVYRITLAIGGGYNSNFISIERLF